MHRALIVCAGLALAAASCSDFSDTPVGDSAESPKPVGVSTDFASGNPIAEFVPELQDPKNTAESGVRCPGDGTVLEETYELDLVNAEARGPLPQSAIEVALAYLDLRRDRDRTELSRIDGVTPFLEVTVDDGDNAGAVIPWNPRHLDGPLLFGIDMLRLESGGLVIEAAGLCQSIYFAPTPNTDPPQETDSG